MRTTGTTGPTRGPTRRTTRGPTRRTTGGPTRRTTGTTGTTRASARTRASTLVLAASLALAAAALITPALHAQPSAREQQARTYFAEAVDALHSGNFPQARELLVRCLELSPNPAVAFNLAVAYRGMGDLLRAEDLLGVVLDGAYGALPAARAREARELRDGISAEIGQIEVAIEGPETTEVRLDGVLQPERTMRVNPGTRILVASAEDHETLEQRVEVAPGEGARVTLTLETSASARVGRLVLEASSTSDMVEVVGVTRALGRLEVELAPGEYAVRVSAGSRSYETVVEVRPRSETRFRFDALGRQRLRRALWLTAVGLVIAGAAAVLVGVVRGPRRAQLVRDPVFGVVVALEGR